MFFEAVNIIFEIADLFYELVPNNNINDFVFSYIKV